MLCRSNRNAADELGRFVDSFDERCWDPAVTADLDLSRPFDTRAHPVMPEAWFPELRTPLCAALSPADRVHLGNEIIRWLLSGILAGERAAAHLCRQIGAKLDDPLAARCVLNQAREEDRHVAAFTRYLAARWGAPYPVGAALGRFYDDLIETERVEFKIVGMSILVEGFAMGALSNIRAHTNDPALRQMLGLVLRDEAVHHGFGEIWLEQHAATCDRAGWIDLQRFAMRGFDTLRVNLLSIRQRRTVYARIGLDWRRVRTAVHGLRRESVQAPPVEEHINPLSVLARNLDRMGLVLDGARPRLSHWLEPTAGARG